MSKTQIKPQTEIKKLERSEIEITGTLPAEDLERHRKKAEKKLSEKLSLPGFRKGHIPEAVLLQKVGEQVILEKMAEEALAIWYPKFITENKLDAIGRPSITLTKLAKGNPLEFKVRVAVMPEIVLGDYRKAANSISEKKEEPIEVSQKEVDEVLTELRKARAKKEEKPKSDEKAEKNDGDAPLPELDDAFAQSLGDFKDVADLTQKIKENITHEKEHKAKEKRRINIMNAIVESVKIDLPEVIIESETDRMIAELKDNIAMAGGKFEEYLQHTKKTEEEIRTELRPGAEKRSKQQLVLNKIALAENIVPDENTVKKEVDHLLDRYKDADPERARIYVETILVNEKVFELLEGQKKEK